MLVASSFLKHKHGKTADHPHWKEAPWGTHVGEVAWEHLGPPGRAWGGRSAATAILTGLMSWERRESDQFGGFWAYGLVPSKISCWLLRKPWTEGQPIRWKLKLKQRLPRPTWTSVTKGYRTGRVHPPTQEQPLYERHAPRSAASLHAPRGENDLERIKMLQRKTSSGLSEKINKCNAAQM